jgi:hypothetical protein
MSVFRFSIEESFEEATHSHRLAAGDGCEPE